MHLFEDWNDRMEGIERAHALWRLYRFGEGASETFEHNGWVPKVEVPDWLGDREVDVHSKEVQDWLPGMGR